MLDSKIIIIDDSTSMLKMIEKIVKNVGFKNITLAKDGLPAWQLLQETKLGSVKKFDLIISDWQMDGMSGLELLKNVRSDEILKGTPFLMVTSNTEQIEILTIIQAGVSDYIVKPFNAVKIQEKIKKILSKLITVSAA